LAISPWIPKGTLLNKPTERQAPFNSSEFELSSVLSTTKNIFNLEGDLTNRTKWAATFDDIFEILDEPRTDCPMTLPDLPGPSQEEFERT